MTWFPGARRLLRLPGRSAARIARDIDEEFEFHLDMRMAELRQRGLSPEAARAEALRRFGDRRDAQEYCRTMDQRSTSEQNRRDGLFELGADVRFAARQLRRSPGFAVLAVLTLALGIGATTAIFSVVNRMLINPIPLRGGDRIVSLTRTNKEGNLYVSPTPRIVEAWRTGVRSIEAIEQYGWKEVTITGGDEPEPVEAGEMEATLPRFLGLRPALGRAFLPEETVQGAPRVAMLGYGLWRRRYGGDREVIGQPIMIDGEPYTVVGVVPRDFSVPFMDGEQRQLWLPLIKDPNAMGAQAIARLRPGATPAQASREMTDVMAALGKDEGNHDTWLARAVRPQDFVRSGTRDMLYILLGAVGIVLLIACANVANLLLARATTRQREFAIRAALGAGRGRIVRQLLTESLILAIAGGLLGLLVAHQALRLIIAIRPERLSTLDDVRLDPLVLAVCLALTMLTGLIFGLAPALFASAHRLGDALKSATRSAAGNRGARRFRGLLVVTEVALSVVLLIGAGLLVRTIREIQRTDPGFDPTHLTAARIILPEGPYRNAAQRRVAFDEVARRVSALPGVAGVTWSAGIPPYTGVAFGELEIEGRTLTGSDRVTMLGAQSATPDYFRVMRLPIVAGRAFSADTSGREVMINETMARRYWPGTTAVGRRLRMGAKGEWSTVVGVARDVTIPTTGRKAAGTDLSFTLYHRFRGDWESGTLLVRTTGEVPNLLGAMTREIAGVDPLIRIRDVTTAEASLAKHLASPRFNMTLLAAFAAFALVLAAVGLYGVIAYSVSQRTREMGIRLALGARRRSVLGLVLGQGARLTTLGVITGLAGAAAATRLMQSMLFGVNPLDPMTFLGVGILLGAVALAASYIPALRATRVDPVIALREE